MIAPTIGFRTRWRDLPPGWRWVLWGIGAGILALPFLLLEPSAAKPTWREFGDELVVGLIGLALYGLIVFSGRFRPYVMAGVWTVLAGGVGLWFPEAAWWLIGGLWVLIPGKARWCVGAVWLWVPLYCSGLWQPILWEGAAVPIRQQIELPDRFVELRQREGKPLLIRSDREWRECWKDREYREDRYAAPPAVDFSRHMVVLCGMWTGPGYEFDRHEIRKLPGELRLVCAYRTDWNPHLMHFCVSYRIDHALVVDQADLPVTFPPGVEVKRFW